jgi:hypothetical protein
VGLFRPARTVTGPSGDYWEIYLSKTALPAWKEGRSGGVDLTGNPRIDLLMLPVAVLGVLWSQLVLPLLRFSALLPVAVLRGRRSRAVRIEAVNNVPAREVLLWTTTEGFADGVLDEIVAGLAAGKVVQPVAAVYSGRESA